MAVSKNRQRNINVNNNQNGPTALQRIQRAQEFLRTSQQPKQQQQQSNDNASLTTAQNLVIQGDVNPKIKFLICPYASRRALVSPSTSSHPLSPRNTNLQKPNNPSKLLQHALTNANGEDWKRQRVLVARALGGKQAKKARSMAKDAAVEFTLKRVMNIIANHDDSEKERFSKQKILQLCCSDSRRRRRSKHHNHSSIDVRKIALEIAAFAISIAVVGNVRAPRVCFHLENMFLDTLQPKRGGRDEDALKCMNALEVAVNEIVEEFGGYSEILDGKETNAQHHDRVITDLDCLTCQLLRCEKKKNSNKEVAYLSRKEVVSNVHSSLMAGTQTTCTTLAGVLLHLAEREDLVSALKVGSVSNHNDYDQDDNDLIRGYDMVQETLRIFPPVGGLPRIPLNEAVEILSDCDDYDSECVRIKKDETVIIDLLALAHAHQQEQTMDTSDESPIETTPSTIQFHPKKQTHSHAQPWGIGERRCPAGSLSVECIGAILESLVNEGITWKLSNPGTDGVGASGKKGWIESISYLPTLSYTRPIHLDFLSPPRDW